MSTIEDRVQAMLAKVPSMNHQALVTTRENALRFGEVAKPLIDAIDERLAEFESDGGMAAHGLEFARQMMRMVAQSPTTQWIAGIDLFKRAQHEYAGNPYVVWLQGNSARKIPLTKAIDTVLPEFPEVEREKRGVDQSDRVYFRRRR